MPAMIDVILFGAFCWFVCWFIPSRLYRLARRIWAKRQR